MAPPDLLVARFLDNACPDHHVRGGSDHVRAEHTAMRLLAKYPDIAGANLATAIVCGDLEGVERRLTASPKYATQPVGVAGHDRAGAGGENDLFKRDWGQKGWQPLLFLCFTRLPLAAVTRNAVAIATALLDRGANPNAFFMAGDSLYTPLVGVIGEGEEARPRHQLRDQLARLLLERGANPYDLQVGYNIHFNGRVLWWLKLIYERMGRNAEWADPEWRMLHEGGYGNGARWYLDTAVEHNDLELADWCLTHGANANAAPGPGRHNRQRSLYDEAIFRGHAELADLLVRHGAKASTQTLDPLQTLISAVHREDEPAIRDAIARNPEWRRSSAPLFAAAKYNRRRAAALLLDLGVSPNVESEAGERALHIAAYNDSIDVARLLIERGADIDPLGRQYDNTPLGGAMHCRSARVTELLAGLSHSAWEVMYAGRIDRLRDLLAEKPERARATGEGETMLMWLPPTDESLAMEAARLLLANGADPTARDPHGLTAADRAEKNAMFEVAEFLRGYEPK